MFTTIIEIPIIEFTVRILIVDIELEIEIGNFVQCVLQK